MFDLWRNTVGGLSTLTKSSDILYGSLILNVEPIDECIFFYNDLRFLYMYTQEVDIQKNALIFNFDGDF